MPRKSSSAAPTGIGWSSSSRRMRLTPLYAPVCPAGCCSGAIEGTLVAANVGARVGPGRGRVAVDAAGVGEARRRSGRRRWADSGSGFAAVLAVTDAPVDDVPLRRRAVVSCCHRRGDRRCPGADGRARASARCRSGAAAAVPSRGGRRPGPMTPLSSCRCATSQARTLVVGTSRRPSTTRYCWLFLAWRSCSSRSTESSGCWQRTGPAPKSSW